MLRSFITAEIEPSTAGRGPHRRACPTNSSMCMEVMVHGIQLSYLKYHGLAFETRIFSILCNISGVNVGMASIALRFSVIRSGSRMTVGRVQIK